jgi:hypothetical protein
MQGEFCAETLKSRRAVLKTVARINNAIMLNLKKVLNADMVQVYVACFSSCPHNNIQGTQKPLIIIMHTQ